MRHAGSRFTLDVYTQAKAMAKISCNIKSDLRCCEVIRRNEDRSAIKWCLVVSHNSLSSGNLLKGLKGAWDLNPTPYRVKVVLEIGPSQCCIHPWMRADVTVR